jgi:hypothetical protein
MRPGASALRFIPLALTELGAFGLEILRTEPARLFECERSSRG